MHGAEQAATEAETVRNPHLRLYGMGLNCLTSAIGYGSPTRVANRHGCFRWGELSLDVCEAFSCSFLNLSRLPVIRSVSFRS